MNEVELIDHLGDYWSLLVPVRFEQNRNGMWLMWVHITKGPASLTEGAYRYQQIPIPIFTEWWNNGRPS